MSVSLALWFDLLRSSCFVITDCLSQLRKYRKSELFMDIDCSATLAVITGNVKLVLWEDKLPLPTPLCYVWWYADFTSQNFLSFSKSVIDVACKDKSNRFDDDFGIEVYMERLDALSPGHAK